MRVTPCIIHSVNFDKCIICIHHHGIIHNWFHCCFKPGIFEFFCREKTGCSVWGTSLLMRAPFLTLPFRKTQHIQTQEGDTLGVNLSLIYPKQATLPLQVGSHRDSRPSSQPTWTSPVWLWAAVSNPRGLSIKDPSSLLRATLLECVEAQMH